MMWRNGATSEPQHAQIGVSLPRQLALLHGMFFA
jgi:hypothetical protein